MKAEQIIMKPITTPEYPDPIVKDMQASTGDSADFASCITEADTEFGYWWCYEAAPHHPDEAITAMIHIAKVVADAEARNSGKTYLVASIPQPMAAVLFSPAITPMPVTRPST